MTIKGTGTWGYTPQTAVSASITYTMPKPPTEWGSNIDVSTPWWEGQVIPPPSEFKSNIPPKFSWDDMFITGSCTSNVSFGASPMGPAKGVTFYLDEVYGKKTWYQKLWKKIKWNLKIGKTTFRMGK
jgi:hypothetical protein